jgi:hypothetical protein
MALTSCDQRVGSPANVGRTALPPLSALREVNSELTKGVGVMTLVEQRPPPPAVTRFARWAWLAIGSVPVGLVVGVVVSFAGEGGGHSAVGGALVGLLCLLAPTLAVCFAGAAVNAGAAAGRNALVVSVPVLALTVVLLPVIAIGIAGWLIAMAIDAALVGGYFAWRYCR